MDFVREPRRAPGVQFSSDAAPKAESASQPVFRRSRAVLLKTGRFLRVDRILCTRDFARAVKSGKRGASKNFVVVIAPRAENTVGKPYERRSRLGVTVSKRVGNSVIRNRIKRRIREWFRHAREELPNGSDIVVVARRAARGLSSSEITTTLSRMTQDARSRGDGRTAAEFR